MTWSFEETRRDAENFQRLLQKHDITIKKTSTFYQIFKNLSWILNQTSKNNDDYTQDDREKWRRAIGLSDLIRHILKVQEHKDFYRLKPHLELLNEGIPSQNTVNPVSDDAARKIFELLIATLVMQFADNVIIDSPKKAKGNNPDILFTCQGKRLGIACKVLQSDSAATYLDRLEEGIKQIERSEAERGFVVFNLKNLLLHNDVFALDNAKCQEESEIYYKSWLDTKEPEKILKKFGDEKKRQIEKEIREKIDVSKLFQNNKKTAPLILNLCQSLSATGNPPTFTLTGFFYAFTFDAIDYSQFDKELVTMLNKSLQFQLEDQESIDPYLWLEDINGHKSLEWVKEQNMGSIVKLERTVEVKQLYEENLKILNSKEKIPYFDPYGEFLYNFWQDIEHPRGMLRRTTLEEYRKQDLKWETVLDVDILAKEEKENWVYKSIHFLYPDYNFCLVFLSRGGKDATVVREFDLRSKLFVKNGFELSEARNRVAWMDKDTVLVGTNFGENSLTKAGYPRIVKLWKRGTPLEKAETIFEAKKTSGAYGYRLFSEDGTIDLIVEIIDFFTYVYYLLQDNKLNKIDLPKKAKIVGYLKRQILVRLEDDWNIGLKSYKQGSVIIGNLNEIMAGEKEYQVLMEPGERCSISFVKTTQNTVLIKVLDNVASKLYQYIEDNQGGWQKKQVKIEDKSTLSIINTDPKNDDYFISCESFLTPSTLYLVATKEEKLEMLKSMPNFFDSKLYSKLYQTRQYEAISTDSTKIPYFVVMRNDIQFNGNNATLLYGYGGFEKSMEPLYSAMLGNAWLSKGGVYVLANIRGGGEFGPKWHQAGMKKGRKKVFEDFIAVAQDLCTKKITSPERLAIKGGSNGGLLVGAVFTMDPVRFKAVICQKPLLDMKRYTNLLAGESFVAEYGDPDDPEMWEYIKTYSPYHNVKKEVKYPAVFFGTSTCDDRVHPAHARKMFAKMKDMGHEVYYYEDTGSSLFSVDDFQESVKLIGKLRDTSDPVSLYLKEKLSEKFQQQIDRYKDGTELSNELLESLVAEFNRLLEIPFFQQEKFTSIKLSEETQRLLAPKELKKEELLRLNRLLLEDTYPCEIAKSQNTGGGHESTNKQLAYISALEYIFLYKQLMEK